MKPRHDEQQEEVVVRARTPKGREVIGILEQRLGASRTKVKCLDGKSRICRIPGRMKRYLWVREGDVVLVEPWEYDNNKGDIVFKYKKNEVEWLKKKGFIKNLESEDVF